MMDYTKFRKMIIEFNQLKNVNDEYYFYYDETNNCRKFLMRENSFNSDCNQDFVLGGVVTKNKIVPEQIEQLLIKMKFQPNMKEFKLKHICGKVDFLECLKSDKLASFLEWVLDNNIYLQYASINVLYFSLVDLVDAYLDGSLGRQFHDSLKSVLYKYASLDMDSIHELLYVYNYPNIDPSEFSDFSNKLFNWLDNIKPDNEKEKIYIDIYKNQVSQNQSSAANILLTNNKTHTLIEDFSDLYIQKLILFKNGIHTLDQEMSIEEEIINRDIYLEGKKLNNYRFAISDEDRMIQVADVVVGLIGKMLTFVNNTKLEDISLIELNDMQVYNLHLINELHDKALNENIAFISSSSNYFQIEKINHLLSLTKMQRKSR